jgi:hypothetical protein
MEDSGLGRLMLPRYVDVPVVRAARARLVAMSDDFDFRKPRHRRQIDVLAHGIAENARKRNMLLRRERLFTKKDHTVIDKRLTQRLPVRLAQRLRQIHVVDHCAVQRLVAAYVQILMRVSLRLRMVQNSAHNVLRHRLSSDGHQSINGSRQTTNEFAHTVQRLHA